MGTTATVTVDARTQQRHAALLRANAIRTARRKLKEQIKAGELDVAGLILDPPATLATAEISEVVQWAPGVGHWRASRILLGLARPTVKLSALGEPTRRRVAQRLTNLTEDGITWT